MIAKLDFLPARKARQLRQIFVKLRSMEELSVITATYEVYKKLLELNTLIDKKYRHTLSEPAVISCLKLHELLIKAKHAPKMIKSTHLIEATAQAELLALQLRAMLELNLANETNLLKIQARLNEARKQITGWRKSLPA
jgi:hypothetical protein